MAYNYYPVTYQPYQQTYQQPQQQSNGLVWVQGEAGAKAYVVSPNSTVLLMDSESDRFYLKSSDASGMPLPLRVFEYSEKLQNAPRNDIAEQARKSVDYATKDDLAAFKAEIMAIVEKKGVKKNAE